MLESTEESGTDVPRGRGGYRVLVRVRPLLGSETGKELAVEVVSRVKLRVARCDQTPLFLRFDRTFEPQCGQADVFEPVRELITAAADGRSATILAYGQTGSGKTHTMIGEMFVEPRQKLLPSVQKGIIARGLEHLFQCTRSQSQAPKNCQATSWRVYVSFMEIYNERVLDLLGENHNVNAGRGHGSRGDMGSTKKPRDAAENRLDVRENPDGSVCVPGVTVVEVHDSEQAIEVLKIGILNRKCGDNGVNRTSSRSHAIFQVLVEKRANSRSEEVLLQATKLNFVDLAGSEKMQPDSSVSGALKQELTSINHSLSSLGNCISALVDQKRTHVPYRNSKLTRLLQDSLRGQSLTAMFICISPAFSALEETLSSLKFADRAKRVILDRQQPAHPARCAGKQVAELTSQVQELQDMLKNEREQRARLQSMLQERCTHRRDGQSNLAEAVDFQHQGAKVDDSSRISSRRLHYIEDHTYHDELAASSVPMGAEPATLAHNNFSADVAKANPAGEVCGIAQLLAMASDVQHEHVEKEEAEKEHRSVGSINLDDAPVDEKVHTTTVESPASSANGELDHQRVKGSDAEQSIKAAKSTSLCIDDRVDDICAQLSVLATQNAEVFARLQALESRAGLNDEAYFLGGRWRRAAIRRLQEASSDPSLSASDLRQLIGEAFAPASILTDQRSESSTEQSDNASPSQHSTAKEDREDTSASTDALHGRMRGRSPTIHEASPWAPLSIALNSQLHPEQSASVEYLGQEAANSPPECVAAAVLSPSTSGSYSSPGGFVESRIDLDAGRARGANIGSPAERKFDEVRRRNPPRAHSPSTGETGTSSPPWGKAGFARDSSEETERGLQIVHSAVSQTSQLAQMRLKALEQRADEAFQRQEQLEIGPLSRGPPTTPRQGDAASRDIKSSSRPKASSKSSATLPSRARPDRGASGSSPVLSTRDNDSRRHISPHGSHYRASETSMKQGDRSQCRLQLEKAHNRALHAPIAVSETHSGSALGRGAPLSGVAATVKEQLRRQKEMLRRGRDDRARLRNERQRSSGSPSPSASPNHELWSCLGRPPHAQAAIIAGGLNNPSSRPSGSPGGGAGSNTRVSEVVSRCWEEFEGALQRASVPSP